MTWRSWILWVQMSTFKESSYWKKKKNLTGFCISLLLITDLANEIGIWLRSGWSSNSVPQASVIGPVNDHVTLGEPMGTLPWNWCWRKDSFVLGWKYKGVCKLWVLAAIVFSRPVGKIHTVVEDNEAKEREGRWEVDEGRGEREPEKCFAVSRSSPITFLRYTGRLGSEQRHCSLTVRQKGRILWGRPFCVIIITKATKSKSKKQCQRRVKIDFSLQ